MLQADENRIIPNPEIKVGIVSEWSEGIENVFIEAEEPWEIREYREREDIGKYRNPKVYRIL